MSEKVNLGQYFYEPEQAAAITGIAQNTSLPKTSNEEGDNNNQGLTGLQLGSGINAPMLDVATPCVFTPAVIVVTSLPAMYCVDGKPTRMGWVIKDLIESHAKSVSGIDFGYSLSTQDAPVGHDGQTMHTPAKTTRGQVSPSFTFAELSGNIVWDTFRRWMFDLNHPDTNASMSGVVYPGAYTMSAYAMSIMVIQFDPTMRPDHILAAAHIANMFPTGIGDLGLKREIGQVTHPERNINFTGIVQHNDYIKTLAMAIAEKLALHKHNYNIAPPYKKEVDENIADIGLALEHKERQAWAEQDGIEAQDTSDENNQSPNYPHRIDPGNLTNNFAHTKDNWDEQPE